MSKTRATAAMEPKVTEQVATFGGGIKVPDVEVPVKVNKAAAIRKILAKKGGLKLTTAEVQAKIKEEYGDGIEVSDQSVYQERRKLQAESEPTKTTESVDQVTALMLIKKLEETLGGIDKLEAMLVTYKTLVVR